MRIWVYGEEMTEKEFERRFPKRPLRNEVVITVNEVEVARVKPKRTRRSR
jgi:hypothetical protein